jgi:hypothetical protein
MSKHPLTSTTVVAEHLPATKHGGKASTREETQRQSAEDTHQQSICHNLDKPTSTTTSGKASKHLPQPRHQGDSVQDEASQEHCMNHRQGNQLPLRENLK